MRFKCRGCNDTFDIPDDKGITRVVCPFCDMANDLREPPTPDPTFAKTAMAAKTYPQAHLPQKVQPHPLAPQLWIMAICSLIVTAIISISFLLTVAYLVEQGKANQKVAEEINRVSDEFNHAMDKTNKEMQQSLKK